MKAISLFSLFILGAVSFAALLTVRRRYRLRRLRQASISPADSKLWQEIATGLFASYDEGLTANDRIELALRSGMRRLRIGCGIITLNSRDSAKVISIVTSDDVAPHWLSAGREISLALTYCGLLNENRENLAIDFASLSDWRLHSAHRDLGWETFIGTRRALSSGEYLTVSFYDWHARDHIFGQEEKTFVAQLANWITAIQESSNGRSKSAANLPELAQSKFESAMSATISQ